MEIIERLKRTRSVLIKLKEHRQHAIDNYFAPRWPDKDKKYIEMIDETLKIINKDAVKKIESKDLSDNVEKILKATQSDIRWHTAFFAILTATALSFVITLLYVIINFL